MFANDVNPVSSRPSHSAMSFDAPESLKPGPGDERTV